MRVRSRHRVLGPLPPTVHSAAAGWRSQIAQLCSRVMVNFLQKQRWPSYAALVASPATDPADAASTEVSLEELMAYGEDSVAHGDAVVSSHPANCVLFSLLLPHLYLFNPRSLRVRSEDASCRV
jgi:hypothetical protein